MTSPASRVARAKAQRVRKCGDLQGKDEGLSRPTHQKTIISGEQQRLTSDLVDNSR